MLAVVHPPLVQISRTTPRDEKGWFHLRLGYDACSLCAHDNNNNVIVITGTRRSVNNPWVPHRSHHRRPVQRTWAGSATPRGWEQWVHWMGSVNPPVGTPSASPQLQSNRGTLGQIHYRVCFSSFIFF